jgi:hypothetical protein
MKTLRQLWCRFTGHKWKRRYYPGLDAEKHTCRRCRELHWQMAKSCPQECYAEPAAKPI